MHTEDSGSYWLVWEESGDNSMVSGACKTEQNLLGAYKK
jgi:hypothetical protein